MPMLGIYDIYDKFSGYTAHGVYIVIIYMNHTLIYVCVCVVYDTTTNQEHQTLFSFPRSVGRRSWRSWNMTDIPGTLWWPLIFQGQTPQNKAFYFQWKTRGPIWVQGLTSIHFKHLKQSLFLALYLCLAASLFCFSKGIEVGVPRILDETDETCISHLNNMRQQKTHGL